MRLNAPHIEEPLREFTCMVTRPESDMRYQSASDGKWHPVHGESVETHTILAETLDGAWRVARYHFYLSRDIEVSDPAPGGFLPFR